MFLEHVNLTVADLDRSVAFYRDLLGLEVRWEGKALGAKGPVRASHVGSDRHYLALFEAEEAGAVESDYGHPGVNHFGFVIDDFDAVRERVATLGLTPHLDLAYEPGRRLYVRDPDGVEIELVSYDPPKG